MPKRKLQSISMSDKRMTEEYREVIPPELEGWTKDEKYDLNLGLKHFGYDLPNLRKRVPTKSKAEILRVIEFFQSELRKTECTKRARKKHRTKAPQVPLAKWADFLIETHNYQELQTELATAVRIIADFEKFPEPSKAGNIDFRKIYHYIADAMEGKPLPEDPAAAKVFHQCIMETSLMSKCLFPEHELKQLLKMICNGNSIVNTPSSTDDVGLAALRCIMSQINYNPMKIPEQYLKYPPKYNDI